MHKNSIGFVILMTITLMMTVTSNAKRINIDINVDVNGKRVFDLTESEKNDVIPFYANKKGTVKMMMCENITVGFR